VAEDLGLSKVVEWRANWVKTYKVDVDQAWKAENSFGVLGTTASRPTTPSTSYEHYKLPSASGVWSPRFTPLADIYTAR